MGNKRTTPPHEGEITGSNEHDKIPKSDLAAWTCTYRLVKAWITAIFYASKTKLGLRVKPKPSLTGSNTAHKKLD